MGLLHKPFPLRFNTWSLLLLLIYINNLSKTKSLIASILLLTVYYFVKILVFKQSKN